VGQGADLPARYLSALVTHRAELGLVIGALVAAVVLWRSGTRPTRPAPASPPADRMAPGPTRDATGGSGEEPRARRVLRIGFGLLWVVDGILQAQPSMPRQFVPMVVEPSLSGQPAWLTDFDRVAVNLWTSHSVSTDAFTVFLQVAIGLAIILGGDGLLARVGLSASIAWGLVVWVVGEALGGVLAPGATWLTGSPGAVLFYIAAAVVLLAVPSPRWSDRRFALWSTRGMGALWLVLAGLQALPAEGFWRPGSLGQVLTNAASNPQPSVLARPMAALAGPVAHHPAPFNAALVAAMAVLGVGLLSGRAVRAWLGASAVWLLATWWLGMDFGVLGGVGTDPNSALAVGLFVGAAWVARDTVRAGERTASPGPAGPVRSAPAVGTSGRSAPDGAGRQPAWWRPALALWLGTAALVTTVWTAVPVLGALPAAAATPTAVTPALVDSGGLASVPGSPAAPDFHLVDQLGRARSLSSWRGKVVILSFLDPVCYSTCPVVAQELSEVATLLDAHRSQLEFVSIDANPDFRSPAVLRSFDAEHGIASLGDWEFLTGSPAQLASVWNAYGAVTETPQVGMVAHSLLLYIIGPTGREVEITQATGSPGPGLEASYAQLFADAAGRLLPRA